MTVHAECDQPAHKRDGRQHPEAHAEGATRVRFTLEPEEGATKLTLVHDQFVENSVLIESISEGWIAIFSNLKTLLETGDVMAVS